MKVVAKRAPGPGHVGLSERPTPAPAAGEVVIEVHAAGVCGTDLHIEAGEYGTTPPVVMGHEISGVVAGVGDGVEPAWLGARVVTETYYATCHDCAYCRDGRPNLCADRRSIGSKADGGFAEHVVVPVGNLHRVPDWLDDHAAALAEPLACVANCLLDPDVVAPGDRVVVVGPGPIGLLAAQVARSQGGEVVVVGLPADAGRLDVARALGFEATTEPVPSQAFDVAIECSGSAGGATACLSAARAGGAYVQVGVFGRPVTVPLDEVLLKELVVRSGFASTPRSWERAMQLIERREVDLAPLVTRAAPLDAWAEVFEELRRGRGLKIVLDPRLR